MAKKKKKNVVHVDNTAVKEPPKVEKVKKEIIHEPAEGWLADGLKKEIDLYESYLTRHYDPEGTITDRGETKDYVPVQVRVEIFRTLDSLHRLVKIYDTPDN